MTIEEIKAAIDEASNALKTKADKSLSDSGVALEKAAEALKALEGIATKEELKALTDAHKAAIDELKEANKKLQIKFENQGKKEEERTKSFQEVLGKSLEDNTDEIEKFNRKEIKKLTLDIDMKAVGAFGTANVTGSTQWGAVTRNGIITNPNAFSHLRDFISVHPAGPGTDFYFMRENGVGEGAIAPVAEGALKAQFDLDLVEASVKFETLAGWMLLSRKAMMNIPGLLSYLNMRLPEKLAEVEDQQGLYGTGVSPQIKGILTAGNFVAGQATGATTLVEKIIKDISLLADTYKRKANGILVTSADYYSFFLNKASGSGEYDLPHGVTFVGNQLYILGIPVGELNALTAGQYVVGDFRGGAEFYMQEAMQIQFFEQDATNVRTNQITVRIEETLAMPVYTSNSFVLGSSLLA